MLEFKSLELADKPLIEQYTKAFSVTSSELNFTTFYIWRDLLNVQFAVSNDCVIYKTRHNENPFSLRFPLGAGDKKMAIEECVSTFGSDTRFYGLTEDMLEYFSDEFEISEMPAYYDYVYESEKLISLAGKKLHSKRNHINSFHKLYESEFSPITEADADFITAYYDKWYDGDGDEYLEQEKRSITDVIKNFGSLKLMGEKLTVGGFLAAFTIGERLNEDTAVVHIEKADTSFKGAYAVINQHFAQHYLKDFKYINREEDMGIEGLKKAKMSYYPYAFVKKYKAQIKE